ncbi:MAG TPA: hypothetical protein VJ836_04710 [Candidatus Saccharimonadales bacterium]|nr:hypothetical protein [Candidatus Saccharimonadales bacterium]
MGKKHYLYVFLGLIALYAVLVFTLPSDPRILEKYHLTQGGVRLLILSIVIPIIAIWLSAFYGFAKIKEYAQSVKDTSEGKPFESIANGLMVLVFSLPLLAAASTALTYFAYRDAAFLPTSTIFRNYLTILSALAAFYLIGKGAEALATPVKNNVKKFDHQTWTTGFIIFSSLFTWMVISHQPDWGDHRSGAYYLPDWLVVLTIVIPYLYIWYRGLLAAYCIYYYQKKVRGTLYKRALSYFSAGIAAVIGLLIATQLLAVFSERLNRLDLTPLLLIIYVLVGFYALGYGLIAKGVKKLKSLEDV